MATAPQRHDDSWDDLKQRMRTRWPALAEADLDGTKGDHEQLLGLLEERLGYASANAQRDLDEVMGGHVIAPHDVADEATHTGTSGPVGATPGGRPLPPRPPIRGGSAAEESHRPDHDSGPRPHERPRTEFEEPQTPMIGWTKTGVIIGAIVGVHVLTVAFLVLRRRTSKKRRLAEMAASTSMAAAGAVGKAARRWGQRAADTDWAEVTATMRDDLARIRDDATRMREDLASATR